MIPSQHFYSQLFLRHPDSVYTTLPEFYNQKFPALEYPASVVAFDIANLTKTNQEKGFSVGDCIILSLIQSVELAIQKPIHVIQDLNARIIVVCPHVELTELEKIANEICSQLGNMVYGLSEASSNFSINIAIEDALEASRIQQLLNPKSKKHEPLFALMTMMRAVDKTLDQHVKRTQSLSKKMAKKMNMPFLETSQLQLVCMLHDIGKLFTPSEILQKPGALTEQEMQIMKQHAQKGADFLANMPSFEDIALYVKYHHERYDGKGYPEGLSGHSIPLLSRIVSLVDAYDAMSNDRVYRKALSDREIVIELCEGLGTQFDPTLTSILIEMIEKQEL